MNRALIKQKDNRDGGLPSGGDMSPVNCHIDALRFKMLYAFSSTGPL